MKEQHVSLIVEMVTFESFRPAQTMKYAWVEKGRDLTHSPNLLRDEALQKPKIGIGRQLSRHRIGTECELLHRKMTAITGHTF
jgi:hypothetical protein